MSYLPKQIAVACSCIMLFILLLVIPCTASPTITITQPFTDTNVCAGSALNIHFTITGSYSIGNIFTTQLSDASGNFNSAINIGSLTTVAGGTISGSIPSNVAVGNGYRIRIISSAPADTSADDGLNIRIKPSPLNDSITVDSPGYFCVGSSLLIHTVNDPTYTYRWILNGATIAIDTLSSRTVYDSGAYTVNITNSFGCTAVSAPVHITTATQPKPVITWSGPDSLFCTPANYKSYEWFKNGVPTGDTESYMSTPAQGQYSVFVTSDSGCSAKSAIFCYCMYLVPTENNKQLVQLYPNPTTGIVNISTPGSVSISLIRLDGREIMHQQNAKLLDISSLPTAVYILKVYSEGNELIDVERLVKTD